MRVTAEDSVSPSDTVADDYYAVLGLVMHQTLTSFYLLYTHKSKGLCEMKESKDIELKVIISHDLIVFLKESIVF